ncbi:MAG TPA: TIGR02281 family clan AA aspartic protease [Rhizorhapis sp.]
MTGAQSADVVWLLLAMILVASALFSRRWSLRSAVATALWWVAIFLIGVTIFTYRDEIGNVAHRVTQEVTGQNRQKIEGGTLRISKALDGHFWVNGRVNGHDIRFLIDSGASITAVSEKAATDAGLDVDQSGYPTILQTANGAIEVRRSNIAVLEIGPLKVTDLRIVVAPAFGDINVLGMNFLSQLKSWRVEGDWMILEPR